jgi:hypothetical protein
MIVHVVLIGSRRIPHCAPKPTKAAPAKSGKLTEALARNPIFLALDTSLKRNNRAMGSHEEGRLGFDRHCSAAVPGRSSLVVQSY